MCLDGKEYMSGVYGGRAQMGCSVNTLSETSGSKGGERWLGGVFGGGGKGVYNKLKTADLEI